MREKIGKHSEEPGTNLPRNRVSVLGESIFRDADPEYCVVPISRGYWKLKTFCTPDNTRTSATFVISQNDTLSSIEAVDLDSLLLFQESLDDLTGRSSIGFPAYANADAFINHGRSTRGADSGSQTGDEYPTIGETVAFERREKVFIAFGVNSA